MVERDLARLLATLSVTVRAGRFAFVSTPQPDAALAAHAQAVVHEAEGVTYIVDETHLDAPTQRAASAFRAAWLTLAVQSALDAVGLTAAVSSALAAAGIACNVVAGLHHDHLLVDAAHRDAALAALAALQRRHAA